MGYYTYYSLSIIKGKDTEMIPCETCGGTGEVEVGVLAKLAEEINEIAGAFEGEPQKWYEHEEDMLKISKRFPGKVFQLKGEGEDNGDIWVKFFYNGRVQKSEAKIRLDKFDPSKLEEPRENVDG
jgi:hypothetical protein